jgi:hypothetical protein
VKTLDKDLAKVEATGKSLIQKMAMPGIGYFTLCHYAEDNRFSV